MKKRQIGFLLVLLAIVAMFAFTACSSAAVTDPELEEPAAEEAAPAEEEAAPAEEEAAPAEEEAAPAEEEAAPAEEEAAPAEEEAAPVEEEAAAPMADMAESLDMNVALGNNSRTLTYQQATPLELPDGSVVTQGNLKPTWQYIAGELGIAINDVTIQDQSASEMMDVSAATGFDNATVFGGNSIAEDFMSYGAQGYFVNLSDHLDQMPNFAAYLEANPNIAKAITAYDGGIYSVPYAAELGNYARVFPARETWVTALLDSDDALEEETHTLTPAYEGYWDRSATNVADLQNEAAAGGELTRDVARDSLLAYIAETYPDLEKPSDLYMGETATYDMDELVALLRVIELSPNTLSKVTTGEVVPDTEIAPFFTRYSRYREDVLRLITYWGGQRVHGSDSYAARFYLDGDGELQFSYSEDGFLEGVDRLAAMYAEGLIHSEFADLSNTENFRNPMYTLDAEEGQRQFGFMTLDWIASTTAANEDVVALLPPLTTVGSDEFIHFNENTRVIKPDGWGISTAASPEEINAALYLFDYFFSDEGHVVQNYGPPYGIAEGEVYVAPDGTEYPKFGDWLVDGSCELKNCDMSGYLRDFIGSQIPIGYQKEIGFELQTTKNRGAESWALWIGQEVANTSYESENPLTRLVPPVFSLTEQDLAKLGQLAVSEEQVDQIFLYITGADTAVDSIEALKQIYIDAGIEDYIEVYRSAYARMTE